MKIVLIHGFNVKDAGAGTVDKLRPYLEGMGYECESDAADYGYIKLWWVRLRKHSAIIRIINALHTADVVVAHSNGFNYAIKALSFILFRPIVLIGLSPAASTRVKFPMSVSSGYVFFTRSDFWVWVSGFLPWLDWGRLGQHGYKGTDPRIESIEFTDVVRDHSDWFDENTVGFTATEIDIVIQRSMT